MSEPSARDSSPCGRRPVHLRRIVCAGYERDDGLWDIEGTLIDTKPFALELPEHAVAAGEPIHEMTVCLTIDRQWMIRDAVARTVHGPYRVCGEIAASYRQLIGLRIEPGFTQRVKRLFRGTLGCSHMTQIHLPYLRRANEALEWGLVTRVVPLAQLQEQALACATRLANGPTRAYGEVRRLYRESLSATLAEQLCAETEALSRTSTADATAAIASFVGKRKPVFGGR